MFLVHFNADGKGGLVFFLVLNELDFLEGNGLRDYQYSQHDQNEIGAMIEEKSKHARIGMNEERSAIAKHNLSKQGTPIVVAKDVERLFKTYKRYNNDLADLLPNQESTYACCNAIGQSGHGCSISQCGEHRKCSSYSNYSYCI